MDPRNTLDGQGNQFKRTSSKDQNCEIILGVKRRKIKYRGHIENQKIQHFSNDNPGENC